MFSHLQESRALSQVTVTWEDKRLHSECPPFPSFPGFIFLNKTLYGMEYLFGQLWPAVPPVSPPNFLCTCSLAAGGAAWKTEKASMLCKHCSAISKISLFYQHCFCHKCKGQRHTGCCEEKELHPSHNQCIHVNLCCGYCLTLGTFE